MPTHGEVWAVGLDVGGTKIAGGLVQFPAGEVVCRHIIPTQAERDPAKILLDLSAVASLLFAQVPSGQLCAGIGIGVPELVDLQGRITSAQTIDWRGIFLSDRFAGMGKVCIEADALRLALFPGARAACANCATSSSPAHHSFTRPEHNLPFAC
jgi:predicted NBD/HSP70 family sugar kinase